MKAMLIKPCIVDCNLKTIENYFLCKTEESHGEYVKDVKFSDLSSEECSSN